MTSRTNVAQKGLNPNGWNLLLSQAIRRAEAKGDARTNNLKKAMRENKAEATLRSYGILGEVDLNREFPA
jgi:hypothetical protein